MPQDKIKLELAIPEAQELLYTCETLAKKVLWVIENTQPKRVETLKTRQRILEKLATSAKRALNEAAKANAKEEKPEAKPQNRSNIVSIKGK